MDFPTAPFSPTYQENASLQDHSFSPETEDDKQKLIPRAATRIQAAFRGYRTRCSTIHPERVRDILDRSNLSSDLLYSEATGRVVGAYEDPVCPDTDDTIPIGWNAIYTPRPAGEPIGDSDLQQVMPILVARALSTAAATPELWGDTYPISHIHTGPGNELALDPGSDAQRWFDIHSDTDLWFRVSEDRATATLDVVPIDTPVGTGRAKKVYPGHQFQFELKPTQNPDTTSESSSAYTRTDERRSIVHKVARKNREGDAAPRIARGLALHEEVYEILQAERSAGHARGIYIVPPPLRLTADRYSQVQYDYDLRVAAHNHMAGYNTGTNGKQNTTPIPTTLDLVQCVYDGARALEWIGERGYYHGSVKAPNIFVSYMQDDHGTWRHVGHLADFDRSAGGKAKSFSYKRHKLDRAFSATQNVDPCRAITMLRNPYSDAFATTVMLCSVLMPELHRNDLRHARYDIYRFALFRTPFGVNGNTPEEIYTAITGETLEPHTLKSFAWHLFFDVATASSTLAVSLKLQLGGTPSKYALHSAISDAYAKADSNATMGGVVAAIENILAYLHSA